jgi:uncharacterized protein (DUF1697 family)
MADLRTLVESLGYTGAKTLLQSGNVVFGIRGRTCAQIEKALETATAKRHGVDTPYFVRNAAEWNEIVEGNPFAREAKADPGHLILLAMKTRPDAAGIGALEDAIKGREYFRVSGSHAYVVYPDGVGESKLTAKLIERKLGTAVTGRNWNTVLKIRALLG